MAKSLTRFFILVFLIFPIYGLSAPPNKEHPLAPEISEVFVNFDRQEISVYGVDFDDPTFYLGSGVIPLEVISVQPDLVLLALPVDLLPGDYVLKVVEGVVSSAYDLTIGAVGPAGPQGEKGDAGETGPAGPSTGCSAVITNLPIVITTEGVFCFAGSLESSMESADAITIHADNVTIDLKGWTLDGPGGGPETAGIYAAPKHKNIIIKNGYIRGFFTGIFLADTPPFTVSQNHIIENIVADRNTKYAFRVEGNNCTLRNNRITEMVSSGSYPVQGMLISGFSHRILNNDIGITEASGFIAGIALSGAHNTVVEHNRIDSLISYTGDSVGVDVRESTDSVFIDNVIQHVTNGMVVNESAHLMLKDNIFLNVTTGISIYSSADIMAAGNIVF